MPYCRAPMHVIGEDTWKRLDVVPAGDCHASSQNMPAGPAWMDETEVENDKIVCLTLSDEWWHMEKTAFRGATQRDRDDPGVAASPRSARRNRRTA